MILRLLSFCVLTASMFWLKILWLAQDYQLIAHPLDLLCLQTYPRIKPKTLLVEASLYNILQYTKIDPKEILTRLHKIKKRGYSIIREEFHPADISISSAITDLRGRVLGAVTVAVSKSRWRGSEDEHRMVDHLMSAERL